jgi:hypothetical protein
MDSAMIGDKPLRVRLSIPCVPDDCELGIPGGGSIWGGCEFVVNPPDDSPCDYWIVLGNAHALESAWVAPENTLFICGEPPAKKRYPHAFYRQFDRVIDTHGWSRHPRLELFAPCLGWGIQEGYDFLANLDRPTKENRVGVVCSSSAKTPGQRQRLKFLDTLKKRLGDRVVHFGRGFNPLENKLDGILPYRFQLVLENSGSDHYWTEKLAGAYLGWGLPIYAGCFNLGEYFSQDAFLRVHLDQPDKAATMIEAWLSTSETEFEIEAVRVARASVMNDYNMAMRCATLARRHYQALEPRRLLIRHYKYFQKRRILQRLIHQRIQ